MRVAGRRALAIDRFARQFRGTDASTSRAAQTLIAFSVGVLGYSTH
jgi:hypothetical protein